MAQRNLKATRIATDTGIARSTLSSITNNSSKMIQLETVNTLCQYLEITPNDFFDFMPFDLSFSVDTSDLKVSSNISESSADFKKIRFQNAKCDCFLKKSTISNSKGSQEFTYDLSATFQSSPLTEPANPFDNPTLNCKLLLGHDSDNKYYESVQDSFEHLWNKGLTLGGQTEIKKMITKTIRITIINSMLEQIQPYAKSPKDSNVYNAALQTARFLKDVDVRVQFSFDNAYTQESSQSHNIFIEFENLPF